MNDLKIAIKQTDDIAWIIEAAMDLSKATEDDLQAIRGKKWYNRLLDTITFSKDDQIHVAKDIGSLAKLQEIIIRVLVMLSQESAAISAAVRQQAELLKGLSAKDTALLNALRKIKYGGSSQIDFSDLDRERKVVVANLLVMADSAMQRNDNSKRYIGSILKTANITTFDNTVNPAFVDDLNKDEQELLYRMIMIDRYLMDADFDEPSEILDWISVNPKRKNEIKSSIINTACAVSSEFFVTYYEKTNATYDEVSAEDIDFESFDDNTEIDAAESLVESIDSSEYQDLILTSILHIPQGETCRYENKNIHVHTIIDCEGSIEFRNCTIHYGEDDQPCAILVKENGSISMKCCRIENHSYSKQFFIDVEAETGITEFIDCRFLNCSNFLSSRNAFVLQQCYVANAGEKFIESRNIKADGTIKDTSFEDINVPDFIIHSRDQSHDSVISCCNLVMEASSVAGTLHINTAEEAADNKKKNRYFYFIDSNNLKTNDSTFVGAENVLYCSGTIHNCTFKECRNIIKSRYRSTEVLNCSFEKCTLIGSELCEGSKFKHCKFNICFNQLMSSHFDGGIQVDLCEFNYCTAKQEHISDLAKYNRSHYNLVYGTPMLSFRRPRGKEYRVNKVTNCVFNGIATHHFVLIAGKVFEKIDGYVVTVENCSFSCCSTERYDGKIIKEYNHYYGLFDKEVEVKTVSVASNCRGLDKIKKL